MNLVSANVRFMRIFAGVPLGAGVKPHWRRRLNACDFGTNRKRMCDFLLVINSNYGPTPILHRFRDTATYWLKIAYFPTPLSFGALAAKLTMRKLESWGYRPVKTA